MRPNSSRITEIRHVGYAFPDLDAERDFYRDVWGLKDIGTHDGMHHFAAEGNDEITSLGGRTG